MIDCSGLSRYSQTSARPPNCLKCRTSYTQDCRICDAHCGSLYYVINMGLEEAIPVDGYLTTQLSRVINWARRSSVWPMPFATACCGIELMAAASSRYDLARFGAEVFRFSPRQADLMIVAGRISVKMMPVLQRIYLQMTEPKWVISMGACASTGGVFDTYAVVQGVDQFMPVDIYVPGCPPRPEMLIEGVMAIQRLIDEDNIPYDGDGKQMPLKMELTLPTSKTIDVTISGS